MTERPLISADAAPARQNADLVARFFRDVLERRDAQAALQFLADDYRDHDPAAGTQSGPAGVVDKLAALWRAFPDGAFQLLELVAAADRVVARSTFTGTQSGPFGALAPSGRAVSVAFFDLYVVEGGRITEHRHIFDQAQMMAQLGAG